MPTAKVTVPAACLGLGPGLDSLGLALTLHNTVEVTLQPGHKTTIIAEGEGCETYPANADHPVLKAITTLAQDFDLPVPDVHIHCTGAIPAGSGLADLAAWTVAGLGAANNLLPGIRSREALLKLAVRLAESPAAAVTALFGGLTVTSGTQPDAILFRRVEVASLKMVLIVPDLPKYREVVPKKVDLPDAAFNVAHALLVVEALRKGDMRLLAEAMQDRIMEPGLRGLIPGFDLVVTAVKRAGTAAVALCGSGPALIAFAPADHSAIEAAARDAFRTVGVAVRTWTLNVDTQGIAINYRQ